MSGELWTISTLTVAHPLRPVLEIEFWCNVSTLTPLQILPHLIQLWTLSGHNKWWVGDLRGLGDYRWLLRWLLWWQLTLMRRLNDIIYRLTRVAVPWVPSRIRCLLIRGPPLASLLDRGRWLCLDIIQVTLMLLVVRVNQGTYLANRLLVPKSNEDKVIQAHRALIAMVSEEI